MPAHRPFWVLRHRVTGQTKVVAYGSEDDSMWEVVLTDGSARAALEYPSTAGLNPPRRARKRSKKA